MTGYAFFWGISQKVSPAKRIVLAYIGDYSGGDIDGECFIRDMDEFYARCQMPAEKVERHIDQLIRDGLLIRVTPSKWPGYTHFLQRIAFGGQN